MNLVPKKNNFQVSNLLQIVNSVYVYPFNHDNHPLYLQILKLAHVVDYLIQDLLLQGEHNAFQLKLFLNSIALIPPLKYLPPIKKQHSEHKKEHQQHKKEYSKTYDSKHNN